MVAGELVPQVWSELVRDRLEQAYRYDDKEQVGAVLQDNPQIWLLLLEIPGKVRQYFGPDTELALKVVIDTEYRREVTLFAEIWTNFKPEKASERLVQLDQEWWIAASRLGNGSLELRLRCYHE
jgi:hypothetical protein